jgi:hypothetical protein
MTVYFSSVTLLLLSLIIISYSNQCWFIGRLIINVYLTNAKKSQVKPELTGDIKTFVYHEKKLFESVLKPQKTVLIKIKQQNSTTCSLTITTVFYLSCPRTTCHINVKLISIFRVSDTIVRDR